MKKSNPKVVLAVVIIYIIWLVLFISWGLQYTKIEVIYDLSDPRKKILAKKFEMPNISDKIICEADGVELTKIKVGPYESIEELLSCFEFKSEEDYAYVYEHYESILQSYKTIEDGEIKVFHFDSSRLELEVNVKFEVYIYKLDELFYFELYYWEI